MRYAATALGPLLLLILVQFSQQATEQGDSRDYYVGAVVEFAPYVDRKDGQATLRNNVQQYANFTKLAKQQGADIIVFPEDGLTSYHMPSKSQLDPWTTVIPAPEEEYVPCTGNRENVSHALKELSCAALANSIYLVANIAEKECCLHAHEEEYSVDAPIYHNTNVVFDRTGKIIARYRKVNLYDEKAFDVVQPPEIVTFDTDFGVKFGTFICFDISFSVPALNLTRQLGVRDFVYTTAWFSEAPFLTAVQIQYGWSRSQDANMLVAGYHNPTAGSTGSGIYLGTGGIADAIFSGDSQSRLLVARVPKKTPGSESPPKMEGNAIPSSDRVLENCYKMNTSAESVAGVYIMRDNLAQFETVPLKETTFNQTVCHGTFCCDFHAVKASDGNETSSIYRAVVYNGCRFYGASVQAGIRVCALTQCSNDSVASCGVVKPSSVTFNEIRITTTVRDPANILAYPSALNSSLLPFERWTYSEKQETSENATARFTIALEKPTSDVSTFGIYMRDFDRTVSSAPELFGLSGIILPILMSAFHLLANNRL